VTEHARAYVRGTQSRGVMACAKHVPGHGDTHVDSHRDLPTIDLDPEVAREREFIPFRGCVDEGVRSVMIGHIVVPFLDPSAPASLSAKVVTDLVRGQWGFDGLVTTDALDMGSITSHYSSAEAALLAVEAGCDVVLMPENADEAIDALVAAIESGQISQARLSQSELRWNQARRFAGLRTADAPAAARAEQPPVDQNAHALVALQAADEALRVVGAAELLPIMQARHVAAFAIVDDHSVESATTWFQSIAQGADVNVDFGYVDLSITADECASLSEGITEADLVIFGVFGKAVAFRGELGATSRLPEIIAALKGDRKCIVVACGSPYGIEESLADVVIYTYSDTLPSIAASVLRLVGKAVPKN